MKILIEMPERYRHDILAMMASSNQLKFGNRARLFPVDDAEEQYELDDTPFEV